MTSSRSRPARPRGNRPVPVLAALLLATAMVWPGASAGQAEPRGGRPLPVTAALTLRAHNGRSPINLSPDGEWLAHTIRSAERVPRGASSAFADTGFPFAEGDSRMEATLTNLGTGETILLGAPDASSWAPAWSPDGSRVAFYSDEGGTAALWIWRRDSGSAHRVGDATVRPFFGFEAPRWDAVGARLLVKLLPEGADLAEANALLSRPVRGARLAEGEGPNANEPEVTVRLSSAAAATSAGAATSTPGASAAPAGDDPLERRRRGMASDLAILHVDSGRLERIVRARNLTLYAFSPDGSRVAYSADGGYDADAQQALFDMHVVELASSSDRSLATAVPLRYGIEWSWSPDGSALAWTLSGTTTEAPDGAGRGVVVVTMPDGQPRRLAAEAPHLSPGEGEVPPIWSADGSAIYGIGGGALWKIETRSGEASEAVSVDGWALRHLVTPAFASPTAWSDDAEDTLWAFGRADHGEGTGLFAVNAGTGEAALRMADVRAGSSVFSIAASDATGQILFTASGQQQPGELFAVDTRAATSPADLDSEAVRRVSSINGELRRYALGESRLLRFRSARGEDLAASVLLPPGHSGGPLPTVVWVYGGSNGSEAVHRFGLWSSSAVFNMHVLASRGYAVLYPDAPVRTGHTTEDLEAAIVPAVDAAVAAGIADPDRLAIMGQSYGSLNTLALLTRTKRFHAAVITAAVLHPDLFADYLRDRNTGYYESGQGDMGGTIWEYPERYRENSPIFDFEEIDTPLLIGQGELDGDLVPAEAIFSALERLGKHVEYRVYGGESHVITGAANVIDFWQRRLEFLAECLRLEVAADGSVSAAGS